MGAISERIYESWEKSASQAEQIAMLPLLTRVQLDCLEQLVTPVCDGNLMSKHTRTQLVDLGLVERWNGLNFLTQDGYCVLDRLGFLDDQEKFKGGKP